MMKLKKFGVMLMLIMTVIGTNTQVGIEADVGPVAVQLTLPTIKQVKEAVVEESPKANNA
jgi:hypothetical protein